MKRMISVLGSTGSIGRQALEVIEACGMGAAALAARRSTAELEAQCRRFRPTLAVLAEERAAADLRVRLADTRVRVASGPQGLEEAATLAAADTVLTAVVGMVGLMPTLAAIRCGKRIALANKETLVCAGQLVMEEAERYNAEIIPVDSEHSALFQCLQAGAGPQEVRRLILTCSGGPFFGFTPEQLQSVTREDALRHPNWAMGEKITVDSATLMNKGLEVMEAVHLFRLPPEKISVVIHRESIIHSLVEYCDRGMLAQLGAPDMRLPIQYALTWPRRTIGPAAELDLLSCPPLTFAPPDLEAFPCLGLALEAVRTGGTAGAALNGANEAAVELFLEGKIPFAEIPRRVRRGMEAVPFLSAPNLEEILQADRLARLAAG